jgi:transposase-like protein
VAIVSPDKVEVRSIHLDLKEHTMTTATMALAELAEKGVDVDVLRQMVQFMAQRLMELDVEGRCGAGYDEKSPERLNSRNGYRAYVKTREAGRIVSVAVIVAVGVNTEGQREVLGLKVGASEAEPFWTEFLRSLNRRGLRGVKLVISDSHEGIKAATSKVLKATWQRCRVHFMRNALAHAGKTQRRMVSAAIGTVFVQDAPDAARAQWRSVADQLRGKFPKLGTLMDDAENDVLAFMTFPRARWTQIYSTNPLERLNAEIKRRTNLVGIFPNDASITRLVGAMMLEQNDEWSLNRRYMQLEGLQTLSDTVPTRLSAVARRVPRVSACPGCGLTPCTGTRPLQDAEAGGVERWQPCKVAAIRYGAEALHALDTNRGSVYSRALVIANGGRPSPRSAPPPSVIAWPGSSDCAWYKRARAWCRRPSTAIGGRPHAALAGLTLPEGITSGAGHDRGAFVEGRGLSGPAVEQISGYWQLGTWVQGDADWQRPLAEASNKTLARLADRLARCGLVLVGTECYRKAEVTVGASTRATYRRAGWKQPACTSSAKLPMTGWLGGYNLQWAWSSAHACAMALPH